MAVALAYTAVRTQILKLTPKHTAILIDVGGRDTNSFRTILTFPDIFLVPVQPRSFDIWSINQVSSLIEEAREIVQC